MELYTILGGIATSFTLIGGIWYIIKKVFNFIKRVDERVSQLERKLQVYPKYQLLDDILVKDIAGNMKTLKKGTIVKMTNVEDGFVTFITHDSLIEGKAPVDNFEEIDSVE